MNMLDAVFWVLAVIFGLTIWIGGVLVALAVGVWALRTLGVGI